jgi:hypothetical protein
VDQTEVVTTSSSQSSSISNVLFIRSARGLLAEVQAHGRSGIEALGGLGHYLEALACIAEQCHIVSIPRILELLHGFQELLLARMVTSNQAGLLRLTSHRRRRGNSLHWLLHSGWVSGISLALVLSSYGPTGWGRRSAGTAFGGSWIIVHSPHVVTEVPVARKAIPWGAALTALIRAQVWFVAMSMHSVGFTLMPKEAGCGRETGVLTFLAPVGFQMRVHEFANRDNAVSVVDGDRGMGKFHTRSYT